MLKAAYYASGNSQVSQRLLSNFSKEKWKMEFHFIKNKNKNKETECMEEGTLAKRKMSEI